MAVSQSKEELTTWLVNRIATEIGLPPERIPLDVNLGRYGLDSVRAVEITSDLTDWLGVEVSSSAMWDFHSINELVEGLRSGAALSK